MLATYFDQYPSHLAATARKQAFQQQAKFRRLKGSATAASAKKGQRTLYIMPSAPDAVETVSSDDGRTYTVSDTSEEAPKGAKALLKDEIEEPMQDSSENETSSSNGKCSAGTFSLPVERQKARISSDCPIHAPKRSSSDSSKSSDTQLIHCGICANIFSSPKILPCLHTFCENCLLKYVPAGSLTLTCPFCRQQSILPKDGVAGLQSNTWIQGVMDAFEEPVCAKCHASDPSVRCHECQVNICDECASSHGQESESEYHSLVSIGDLDEEKGAQYHNSLEDTTLFCPSHNGQTLRFYCRDCETAICSSCTDIEHRAHSTLRMNDAAEEHKHIMQQLIDKVTMQLPSVKEAICDVGDVITSLEEERAKAEKEIRSCFMNLFDLLSKRQTELLNSLNTIVSQKRKILDDQRDELEDWICGVETGCEFVEKALLDCSPMEMLLVRKQLGERLMDFSNMNVPPAPRENSNIKFSVGNIDPLKTALRHVGSVQSNNAVPHQSCATGDALRRVTIGRQSIVTVITRDYTGEKTLNGGAEVNASLSPCRRSTSPRRESSSPMNGKISPLSNSSKCSLHSGCHFSIQVLDLNNGTYEVAFKINQVGQYELALNVFGQPIVGSPFIITTSAPDGTEDSDYSSPGPVYTRQNSRSTQGICYSSIKDGRIAVADSNNQCIQVFSLTGECKLRFGVRGRTAGQLQRPTGVSALPNGNYIVADYENKWISIFEPNGKYISRIGHGKLLGPKGVCTDSNGHIIVVDNKGSCVCIFQQSGRLLSKFGNRALDGMQFAGPHFAAVNSRGEMVITDFHNHCVKVFDGDGEFLFTFGSNGEGNGQFNAPTGVAIDANDNIIVADWGNSRIQVFDNQGSFLTYVNTSADSLYGPQGLALTADGNIVVADSGNHCFKVYKYF